MKKPSRHIIKVCLSVIKDKERRNLLYYWLCHTIWQQDSRWRQFVKSRVSARFDSAFIFDFFVQLRFPYVLFVIIILLTWCVEPYWRYLQLYRNLYVAWGNFLKYNCSICFKALANPTVGLGLAKQKAHNHNHGLKPATSKIKS